MMTDKQKLEALMHKQNSQQEAFALFDSLEPVSNAEMIGPWRGREITSGHPMEGLLSLSGWHGKRFESEEDVFPLVMKGRNGKRYNLQPNTMKYNIPRAMIPLTMRLFKPFLSMKKSVARLRTLKHRGVVTSAMLYDSLAIIDVFRKVDENTLMGVMDFKDADTSASYFFVLDRE